MEIMGKVAESLQRLFGSNLDELGIRTGVIKRRRAFSGMTLLRTLVLTVLKHPQAAPADFKKMADQLGVHVSKAAIPKRFTDELITFLQAVLESALAMVLGMEPATRNLLAGFTAVFIGDATTLSLPDEYADQFPGCGGTERTSRAAMKIQVLWEFLTGSLRRVVIEPGKSSDAMSPIARAEAPAGSLSLFDLGYFCLERFRRLTAASAFWISRLQINTRVFDLRGRELHLLDELQQRFQAGERLVDMEILLGAAHQLRCRLIAVRIPQEEVARRRQKAYEKAAKHGRVPSREYLQWQEWTIFVTNCPTERLTWKAIVVLYRTRWQIELMFKIWKSHNGLLKHRPGASAKEQVATMFAKLIGVIVQHWLLISSTWNRGCRSLMKAAQTVPDWITSLAVALDDRDHLVRVLTRLASTLEHECVESRRNHPSLFQLLEDPELLDWRI